MNFDIEFIQLQCGECSIPFAISRAHFDRLHQTHKSFWCPNGHERHYPGESDEEKLKRQLAQEKRSKNEALHCCTELTKENEKLEYSNRGYKGKFTQMKNEKKHKKDIEETVKFLKGENQNEQKTDGTMATVD